MVDIEFADKKDRKILNCDQCPESQKRTRKCGLPGFRNANRPTYRVDERGQLYTFCPGKAQWFEPIVSTYLECKFAFKTGILPRAGHLEDQDELFVICYPAFVEHYTERRYGRVWQDVQIFTGEVFKALHKMFGGKGK